MGKNNKWLNLPIIQDTINKAIPKDCESAIGVIGNEAVFVLCQYLMGVIPLETSSDELECVFVQWYEKSRYCLGVDFITAWLDFCTLWDDKKVKHPKRDTLNAAIVKAKTRTENRPELAQYHNQVGLLAHVCYYLQESVGAEPFFISGENAGVIMGLSQRTGDSALKYLRQRNIIELVSKGYSGKASEYRYIAKEYANMSDLEVKKRKMIEAVMKEK